MVCRDFLEFIIIIVMLLLFNCKSVTNESKELQSDSDTEIKIKQALLIIDLLRSGYLKVNPNNKFTEDVTDATTKIVTAMSVINKKHVDEEYMKIKINGFTKGFLHTTPDILTVSSKDVDKGQYLNGITNGVADTTDRVAMSAITNRGCLKTKCNKRISEAGAVSTKIPKNTNIENPYKDLNWTMPQFRRYGKFNASIKSVAMSELHKETILPSTKKKKTSPKKRLTTASFSTAKVKRNTKRSNRHRNKGNMRTMNPNQQQVASELADELKSEGITRRSFHYVEPNINQRKIRHGANTAVTRTKSTIKIHLDGSTRIPVPLPQNNAFCYTNPNNALCKTII